MRTVLTRLLRLSAIFRYEIIGRIRDSVDKFLRRVLPLLTDQIVTIAVVGLAVLIASQFPLFNIAGPAQGNLILFDTIAGLICALLLPWYYWFRQDALASRWNRIARQLGDRVMPNSGPYVHSVELQPKGREKRVERNFASIPGSRKEIMLILKQVESPSKKLHYDLGSIRDQIKKIKNLIDKKNEKAQRRKIGDWQKTKISWVCFMTKSGKFAAFQKYRKFCVQIFEKKNNEYVDLLNIPDEKKFLDEIKTMNIFHNFNQNFADPNTPRPGGLQFEHTIPSLQIGSLWEKTTKLDALRRLIEKDWVSAMVVSQKDNKPLGVASFRNLISDVIMREYFPKDEVEGMLAGPIADLVDQFEDRAEEDGNDMDDPNKEDNTSYEIDDAPEADEQVHFESSGEPKLTAADADPAVGHDLVERAAHVCASDALTTGATALLH